jgi:hypothetical protein
VMVMGHSVGSQMKESDVVLVLSLSLCSEMNMTLSLLWVTAT